MRKICSAELSFNKRTGNSKGFAFAAVYIELHKLTRIEFHGKRFLNKESTSRRRSNPVRTEILNTSYSHNLVSKFPKKQNAPVKPSIVPGNSSYAKSVNYTENHWRYYCARYNIK